MRNSLLTIVLVVVAAVVAVTTWQGLKSSDEQNAPPRDEQASTVKSAPLTGTEHDVQGDSPESDTSGTAASPSTAPSALPTLAVASNQARREQYCQMLDPESDGWKTEAVSDEAKRLLKLLAKALTHPADISAKQFESLIADGFRCGSLRPQQLTASYKSAGVLVSREDTTIDKPRVFHEGSIGLTAALTQLARPLGDAHDIHVHVKVFRIEPAQETADTWAYLEVSGRSPQGMIQLNATWRARWQLDQGGKLQLVGLAATDYEEVNSREKPSTWFAECTESVLGQNPSYREQLGHSTYYWAERIEWNHRMSYYGHQGLAVADVNGDGLDDLYVCQPGGLPNRLYVQNPDGTATDMSAAAGVDVMHHCHSALLVDLDNDGDQDLILSASGLMLVFANDGQGQFTVEAQLPDGQGASAYTLNSVDFDNDGRLDIYACTYADIESDSKHNPRPVPFYDARNGGRNVLLRNEGNWKFTDVTEPSGLDASNRRWSLSAAWEDFDNDGDMDLYVANDFGRNCLYRNDQGQFVSIAQEAGVEDIATGMSVSWGDYNHDGRMDLYVGNMFSSAGNRITYQRQFKSSAPEAKKHLQRVARGNSLFENSGDGTFRDVSEQAAVTMGRWAWSSPFVDLNNDGWEDLVVANGYVSGKITKDL